MAAKIDEAIVVLPPDTGAEWFRQLGDGWCCCFTVGVRASVVAYHGPRVRLFEVAMHAHGAVMHSETVVVRDDRDARGVPARNPHEG